MTTADHAEDGNFAVAEVGSLRVVFVRHAPRSNVSACHGEEAGVRAQAGRVRGAVPDGVCHEPAAVDAYRVW